MSFGGDGGVTGGVVGTSGYQWCVVVSERRARGRVIDSVRFSRGG